MSRVITKTNLIKPNVKTIKLSLNESLQSTGKASVHNLIPQLYLFGNKRILDKVLINCSLSSSRKKKQNKQHKNLAVMVKLMTKNIGKILSHYHNSEGKGVLL